MSIMKNSKQIEGPAKNMPFWMQAIKDLHPIDKDLFFVAASEVPFGPLNRKYSAHTVRRWVYLSVEPSIAFSEWANKYFRDLEEKKQLLIA